MLHKLTIDRLFNLGDYQNVHIISETSDITDNEWNDPDEMDKIRAELNLETFMNLALTQNERRASADAITNRDWPNMYETLRQQRHQYGYEIDIPAPEPIFEL